MYALPILSFGTISSSARPPRERIGSVSRIARLVGHASRILRTRLGRHRHQPLPCHPQIRQRKQPQERCGVLRQSAVAHLGETELAFDQPPFVWRISGSCFRVRFFVEFGAEIRGASTTGPLPSVSPHSSGTASTATSIFAFDPWASSSGRKRRTVLSSGSRGIGSFRVVNSRYSGMSCRASSNVGSPGPNKWMRSFGINAHRRGLWAAVWFDQCDEIGPRHDTLRNSFLGMRLRERFRRRFACIITSSALGRPPKHRIAADYADVP